MLGWSSFIKYIFILGLVLTRSIGFSQNAVEYFGQEELLVSGTHIQFLGAGDSLINIDVARKAYTHNNFITNTLPDLNLGIAKDNFWITFTIKNNSIKNKELFITLENPRLNEVDIYQLLNDSANFISTLGDNFPFKQRIIQYNQFVFPINLNTQNQTQIYLFVKHKGNTLQMPIRIQSKTAFYNHLESSYLITGVFTGVLLITFVFGVFFLINTKDILFTFYSGYVITACLWLWATEGYGFQYIWPTHPELATRLGPGLSAVSACFFLLNCIQFTKPYDSKSFLRKVIIGVLVFMVFWSLLPFMPFVELTSTSMAVYLSVYFSLNLGIALLLAVYLIKLSINGHVIVLYYFFAVIITMACSFLIVLRGSGVINLPVSSGILMGLGYIFEIILMTAGITKQFYIYKKEKEETLLAYLEQQKSITSKVLQTQDAERNRISKELHDDIGPKLTQITLISETLKRQTSAENKSMKELDLIAENSRQLVTNMSEIIWSLNPQNKSLQSLLGYLREQLNVLLEYSGIEYVINFDVQSDRELNHAQLRTILLVTKEIVHNAIKYSQAKNIKVNCSSTHNGITFLVEDNGIGFDLTKQTFGSGLRNIKSRIEDIGGSLQLRTNPQNGTQFEYFIPF